MVADDTHSDCLKRCERVNIVQLVLLYSNLERIPFIWYFVFVGIHSICNEFQKRRNKNWFLYFNYFDEGMLYRNTESCSSIEWGTILFDINRQFFYLIYFQYDENNIFIEMEKRAFATSSSHRIKKIRTKITFIL